MIVAERYHDISCGHRVVGHEGKCALLHGHNYRVHFRVTADRLDDVGRVLDFSVIKSRLCQWLEEHFDHKFLMWHNDPALPYLSKLEPESIVKVPFNPTAENIAQYILDVVAPVQLQGTGCKLISCTVEETRKCQATVSL